MSRAMFITGGEGAHRCPGMDSHTFSTGIDSNQPVIPLHPDIFTDEHMRHRVVTVANLDMSIGMHGAGPDLEETETF